MDGTGHQASHHVARTGAAHIAALFDVLGKEPDTIRQLSGCVAVLQDVQAAKRALSAVSAAEVRAALAYRRSLARKPS